MTLFRAKQSEPGMVTVEQSGPSALLLLDFQRDFLADDGRMPVARHHVAPVLAAAHSAAEQARLHGDLVIKIGNEFRRSDVVRNTLRHRAALIGSAGAEWDDRIDIAGAVYLPKAAPSAFSNPALHAALGARGIRHLRITGLYAKACVRATAEAALRRGLTVEVLAEAVACSSDRSRERALTRLTVAGVRVTANSRATNDPLGRQER